MASNLVIGALRATLGLDTAAFEEGVTLTDRRLAALQKKFKSVGASIGKVGRTLSVGLTLPMLAAGGAVLAMSDDFKAALKEFGEATKDLAEAVAKTGLLDFITDIVREITSLIQGLAATNPELLKWGVLIAGAATVLGPLVLGIGALVTGIGAILPVLAAVTTALAVALAASGPLGAFILIAGAISAAWNVWGDDMIRITGSALTAVGAAFTGMIGWAEKLFHGLDLWLKQKSAAIFNWLEERVKSVGDFFGNLYQRVVGGSFIPDMVRGVEQWMDRLGTSMPASAETATVATGDAFERLGTTVAGAFESIVIQGEKVGDVIGNLGKQLASSSIQKGFSLLLGSLFGGTGNLSGIGKSLAASTAVRLPGFASGGSFKVGGSGGVDSQIAAFRVSPNETVSVTKPGQGMGGGTTVNLTVANDFRGAAPEAVAAINAKIDASNRALPEQIMKVIGSGRIIRPARFA